MQCACIPSQDPYPTLSKTLEFIQAHQVSKDGILLKTTFFISFALRKDYVIGSNAPRDLTQFVLSGIISHITPTTVQLIEVSSCDAHYDVYTLSLKDICTLRHDSLGTYADAYICALEQLPPLCCDAQYSLMPILQQSLLHNTSTNTLITIIYGRISSLKYAPTQLKIIRNLLIVSDTSVLPFSKIQGFFVEQDCPPPNNDSPEEGRCL